MKKPIAILLLVIYLFNLAGYSLVFHYLILQSEQRFARQLDEHQYKDADLLEINIPFNLPYTPPSTGFERLNGSVELNGVLYNYVKRRIYHDTLYILCLPNCQKTQLAKEKSNYAIAANDLAASGKAHESTARKAGFSAEYHNLITQYSFVLPGITVNRQSHNFAAILPAAVIDTPGHPPEITC